MASCVCRRSANSQNVQEAMPFASMFCYMENFIQYFEVSKMNILHFSWKTTRNYLVLYCCYLHTSTITTDFELGNV